MWLKLLKNWKLVLFILMIIINLVLVTIIYSQKNKVTKQKGEIKLLKQELVIKSIDDDLKDQMLKELDERIILYNKQINEMKIIGEKQRERINDVEMKVIKISDLYKNRIREIREEEIILVGGDGICNTVQKDGSEWINSKLQQLLSW